MFAISELSTGWTDFDDSIFICKLMLPVGTHFGPSLTMASMRKSYILDLH